MLVLAGYDVVTATNGGDALAAYEQAAKQGRPFDLVILNLTAGGEADGLDTLARLRSMDPGCVVMLSRSSDDDALVARAVALGRVAFIQKPYLQHELLSCAKALIRKSV